MGKRKAAGVQLQHKSFQNIMFAALCAVFLSGAFSVEAQLISRNDVKLSDIASTYSPSLIMQGEPDGSEKLVMYFGGWDFIPTGRLPQDTIFRAECDNGFNCTSYEAVIDPVGSALWQVNDPSVIRIEGVRPYYIMYMTGVVDIGDPDAGYTVSNNKTYYSVSWADDGRNWSVPTLLLEDLWLPSATVRGEQVYVYGNSNKNGLVLRYALGAGGNVPSAPEATSVVDGAGNPLNRFYLNVDVMWRKELGFYQILAEYMEDWEKGVTTIDYLTSQDGLVWKLEREGVVKPAEGSKRVLTPAPHPHTHCWAYYGQAEYAQMGAGDLNIHATDWCNGFVPPAAVGKTLTYPASLLP